MKKTLFTCLPMAAAIFCSLLLADFFYYRQRVYPGVCSHHIQLGGKTAAELQDALQQARVTLAGPEGLSSTVTLGELGIQPSAGLLFVSAYSIGRNAPWPWNIGERLAMLRKRVYLPLQFEAWGPELSYGTEFLEKKFNRRPVDATYRVARDNRHIEIVPAITGYRLHRKKYRKWLQDALNRPEDPLLIALPFDELQPKVTTECLRQQRVETLLGFYTTTFDASLRDRVHNMSLACGQISDTLLAPGEVFSINSILGESTPEKGYRKAPIISGGELVPGYGGGLCQVSTTLYNAALFANLQILERHNHQLTVPYVPPGRDATIFYASKDLQFRNNKGHHVLLHGTVDGHEITFRIFGAPAKETVTIESKILEVYMPPLRYINTTELPAGAEELTEGEPGYLVEVWKTVLSGNKILSKRKISTDIYQPYPAVIKRGIAPIPTAD